MKAVVLAAGQGLRMRPLTENKPKALVELAGKSFIEHVLKGMAKAGVKEVGIVVGRFGEMVREKIGSEFEGMKITFIEQEEALGTAHAIGLAKEFAKGAGFICTYSDVIGNEKIYGKLIEESEKREDIDMIIVGREEKEPWRFGVLEIEGNSLKAIVEKPAKGEEPSNMVNAGIYWFSPKIFELIKKVGKSERGEFEITDAIQELAFNGKAGFISLEGKYFDIGTKEELEEAEKEFRN